MMSDEETRLANEKMSDAYMDAMPDAFFSLYQNPDFEKWLQGLQRSSYVPLPVNCPHRAQIDVWKLEGKRELVNGILNNVEMLRRKFNDGHAGVIHRTGAGSGAGSG